MEDAQKRKERYERNKAQILEKARIKYQSEKEEKKEKVRNYQQENREKVLEKKRSYYLEHKEENNKRSKEYRENHKEQISLQRKEHREQNKDTIREIRKRYREKNKELLKEKAYVRKYGITLETYKKMLEQQKSCCAICKTHIQEFDRMLAVDHDHNTGRVRSLLCSRCNCGLGNFKDNIDFLQKAIEYLTFHNS